jgi:hypothetical protein
MIVGADASSDRDVLTSSSNLYVSYKLKRVYYSAFSPIPDASKALPLRPPSLVREHRLYQAGWLMRFYDFNVDEIAPASRRAPSFVWARWPPKPFSARNSACSNSAATGTFSKMARVLSLPCIHRSYCDFRTKSAMKRLLSLCEILR